MLASWALKPLPTFFVIHLHTENPKSPPRTAHTGSTTGKQSPPTHPFVSPLFCLWGRFGVVVISSGDQKPASLLERLGGSRGGMRTLPSGSWLLHHPQCQLEFPNRGHLGHVGVAGITPQRQDLTLAPLSPRGLVGTIPGSAWAPQTEAAEVKPVRSKFIFLQELGKACGDTASSG